jgi:hypothetical protein
MDIVLKLDELLKLTGEIGNIAETSTDTRIENIYIWLGNILDYAVDNGLLVLKEDEI